MSDQQTWYRVTRYGRDIHEQQFIRETDKMLVSLDWRGNEKRDAKVTASGRWYRTRERAEQAFAEIKQRNAEKDAAKRIRDAAPELLEALEAMVEEWVDYTTVNNLGDPYAKHNMKLAQAALAKARGEA